MRRLHTILLLMLLSAAAGLAQSGNNYISRRTYIWPEVSYVDITYYDGLGYPAADVQVGAGSEGNVVTPYELDAMRRLDARAYLPYPSASSAYDAGAVAAQQAWYQNRFGTGQTRNYTETVFETYASGRPVSRRLPGAEYEAHPDTIAYRLNTDDDSILDISYVYGETPAFRTAASHIPAGSLRCTETTDADGRTSMTFTNPFGLPVLERRVDGNSNVDTYYVHDLKDSLVCVIQPEGSAMLAQNATYSYDLSSPIVERHCFLRQYDGRGRIIRSRQPGSGWEDYAYDERGRVVFSRDAVMAGSDRWIYSEYDCYDRLTARYLIQSSASLTQIRSIAAFSIDTMQEDVLGNIGATVTALLESHSYDDTGYDATNPAPVPSYLAFSPVASNVQGVADIAPALRLSTSRFRQYYEKLLILPSDGNYTNPQYVERAYYYDPYGRVLQIVERNAHGGTTRSSWNYDMAGNVISSHKSVTMGTASKTVLKAFEQNSRGRIINERTYIDGASTPTTSVQYSYDVLGRRNAISSGGLIQADHYALQGWSVQRRAELNSSILFDEYMRRDDAFYGTPSHTGAIAEVFWMWNNQPAGTCEYSYDNLGRLTDSRIWMYGQPNSYFSERDITYDRNGNITALKRYGSSSSAPVDNLAYTYDGNRIASVNGMQYSHDANGNVTEDGYHETKTSYNLLNLPCRVENPESTLYYSYLADGTKVAMTADDGRGYAYFGDVIFSRSAGGNYAFESFSYGGGRIEGPNNTVRHYVTDHLGNVRAVVTDGQVVERNDYYPFGGRHARSTLPVLTSNRWRLGAKEIQPSAIGSLVDFGARMYDPLTGRWTTQDPMAWKYLSQSPYNYCGNDPVNLVDPDGRSTWVIGASEGRYIVVGGNISDNDLNIYLATITNQGAFIPTNVNIGKSLSLYSFYNTDNGKTQGWRTGSIINLNDNSGIKYLAEISELSPVEYFPLANTGGQYDFKTTNGIIQNNSKKQYSVYRGMPIHLPNGEIVIASARDIGNYGAGYVAGKNGFSWWFTRMCFDGYQSYASGILNSDGSINWNPEGLSSVSAQYIGWKNATSAK